MKYIIVQAGGKGVRLKYLTANKPKALVPIENKPMLFHLFSKFPDKKFIVIADYKREVMHEYLEVFADVQYQVIDACGTGTCAGIQQAIALVPEKEPFLLIWSDLILPDELKLPKEYEDMGEVIPENDYVGISQTFCCRWSYKNGRFIEENSYEQGVAGFFLFTEKEKIKEVPESGELVRWMQQKDMVFNEIGLAGTKEFGLIDEYDKLMQEKCRPFNRITFKGNKVVKEGITEQGRRLAVRERAWYEKAVKLGVTVLPKIYGTDPLEMERINGGNIYEYGLSREEKRIILKKLVDSLQMLHDAEQVPSDKFSCMEAYFNKTYDRIRNLRDLIPFADNEYIVVNGRSCRNIFFYKRQLEQRLRELPCEVFCFIHGDCTFSNLMMRRDGSPVLIDPRGYFGYTELYGDPRYDWAKLYYSIVGNYDRFNLKDFRLNIEEREVSLTIQSNHWEDMEEDFFEMTQVSPEEIKLLHGVIWLSLTTYAWQDYDSICGAFYNGLYYLEEVL
jgi:thiamine kinase-like enzyme